MSTHGITTAPAIPRQEASSVGALKGARLISGLTDPAAAAFVREAVALCGPKDVHVCDGSAAENQELLDTLEAAGASPVLPARDSFPREKSAL